MKTLLATLLLTLSTQAYTANIDDILNKIYKNTLLKIADNQELSKALKDNQTSFIKYRDSQCLVSSGLYANVISDEQIAENEQCIKTFNNDRINYLNHLE